MYILGHSTKQKYNYTEIYPIDGVRLKTHSNCCLGIKESFFKTTWAGGGENILPLKLKNECDNHII